MKCILKEKNNELWIVYYFGFEYLDNFIGLFRLADKKIQETKLTYCIDKQKINITMINVDNITTKRPAGNTRLCSLAG